jgi:hypothetical protein
MNSKIAALEAQIRDVAEKQVEVDRQLKYGKLLCALFFI